MGVSWGRGNQGEVLQASCALASPVEPCPQKQGKVTVRPWRMLGWMSLLALAAPGRFGSEMNQVLEASSSGQEVVPLLRASCHIINLTSEPVA